MSYQATVSIEGYDLPEPTSYDGTASTLVDSARNAQGRMIGSVLREDLAKVEMKWTILKPEDWSNILKCFNSTYGGNFYRNVTFLNQVTNNWETREMYVSDRKSGILSRDTNTGAIRGYSNCSLSLIEV